LLDGKPSLQGGGPSPVCLRCHAHVLQSDQVQVVSKTVSFYMCGSISNFICNHLISPPHFVLLLLLLLADSTFITFKRFTMVLSRADTPTNSSSRDILICARRSNENRPPAMLQLPLLELRPWLLRPQPSRPTCESLLVNLREVATMARTFHPCPRGPGRFSNNKAKETLSDRLLQLDRVTQTRRAVNCLTPPSTRLRPLRLPS
jgi:hypothetical protein